MADIPEGMKFLPEEEYVKSFTDRGLSVPPFIVFMEYVEINGIKGYIVPAKQEGE